MNQVLKTEYLLTNLYDTCLVLPIQFQQDEFIDQTPRNVNNNKVINNLIYLLYELNSKRLRIVCTVITLLILINSYNKLNFNSKRAQNVAISYYSCFID